MVHCVCVLWILQLCLGNFVRSVYIDTLMYMCVLCGMGLPVTRLPCSVNSRCNPTCPSPPNCFAFVGTPHCEGVHYVNEVIICFHLSFWVTVAQEGTHSMLGCTGLLTIVLGCTGLLNNGVGVYWVVKQWCWGVLGC